jgi:hypothetical protein
MSTTPHQFETMLNSLIHGVSAITQAATAPITRLNAALRPLPAVRSANGTLTRLITVAGSACAADVDGSTRNKPLRPATIIHEGTGRRRFRQDSERPVRKVAQLVNRVAGLAPRRTRPAPDASRADSRARSLDTSMRRFANIVAAPVQCFTSASSNAASKLSRQAALANNAFGGFSAGPTQSRRARPTDASSWSISAHVLGGLRTTITRLYPLLAPARARARSVAAGERLSQSTVTSMLTRLREEPRFTFSSYSNTTQPRALSRIERALSQQPLTAYLRRLDTLARTITSVATRSAGAASPNVAALPHGAHLQPAWLRELQVPESPRWEVSPRRGPLFNRLDRSAPASVAPTPAPVPPSTINVAINVHGVASGDDFVRRHGFAIAQVLDQVMERRARRAF